MPNGEEGRGKPCAKMLRESIGYEPSTLRVLPVVNLDWIVLLLKGSGLTLFVSKSELGYLAI